MMDSRIVHFQLSTYTAALCLDPLLGWGCGHVSVECGQNQPMSWRVMASFFIVNDQHYITMMRSTVSIHGRDRSSYLLQMPFLCNTDKLIRNSVCYCRQYCMRLFVHDTLYLGCGTLHMTSHYIHVHVQCMMPHMLLHGVWTISVLNICT